MPSISIEQLSKLAAKCGLNIIGHLKGVDLKHDLAALKKWQEKGYAADLAYMKRDVELFSGPKSIFDEVKSAIFFSVAYSREPLPPLKEGYGRIARYAWGKDYHRVLKKRLKKLVSLTQEFVSEEISSRVFSDAVPLLERALARNAGLGFTGKNTMLIKPGEGSFFFIAEILWDLSIKENSLELLKESCGTCNRCQSACPTNALAEDYVLDARKCISYLTIEKKGDFSDWESRAIGEWLFGCDLCQEACPFNHKSLKLETKPSLDEFLLKNGAGPMLSIDEILRIKDDNEFLERFAGTPIMRTKRSGLQRNARAVARNLGLSIPG